MPKCPACKGPVYYLGPGDDGRKYYGCRSEYCGYGPFTIT